MRRKFDQQGMRMEKMGKEILLLRRRVLDTRAARSRFLRLEREIQPVSWKTADKRTYKVWAEKKYDIIVFGMPASFHYGNGMGATPSR